jgi:hypothetical protein
MRRIIVLLTVAAAMAAMVVLTASGAVAQPQPLVTFCNAHQGTITFGPPTCTYTETAEVPAQHGFTLTTSQVFTLTIMQVNVEDPLSSVGTPVGEPTIVSCQNPGGKDVPVGNPNCTPVS